MELEELKEREIDLMLEIQEDELRNKDNHRTDRKRTQLEIIQWKIKKIKER